MFFLDSAFSYCLISLHCVYSAGICATLKNGVFTSLIKKYRPVIPLARTSCCGLKGVSLSCIESVLVSKADQKSKYCIHAFYASCHLLCGIDSAMQLFATAIPQASKLWLLMRHKCFTMATTQLKLCSSMWRFISRQINKYNRNSL